MDKISIIVPVYNVEAYLRKCIDSIIKQTYKNIEILCVNDGSTDGSGEICDEYAAQDSRVLVFHKANGGLSSARNIGLKNITGQYVGFVDSDDWIEPDMYEMLYDAIKSNNATVSACGFFTDTDSEILQRVNKNKIPERVLSPSDMLEYIFMLDYYNAFHIVVWNKLYAAELFSRDAVSFDEALISGSDVLFMPQVFLTKGCTGVYINKSMYHYYQRKESLVHDSPTGIKINGSLSAYKIVITLLTEHGYSDLIPLVKKEICYYASLIAELALKEKDQNVLLLMQKEMRLYLKEYAEVYKEYPERIERIEKLLALEIK